MSEVRRGKQRGAGGFGVVFEAERVSDTGEVSGRLALKELSAEALSDPEARARFVREVRLQDELDHPNVMPIVGRNLSSEPPYFLMPLAESNLREELGAGRVGKAQWVIDVFAGILEGVAHAHGRGRSQDGEGGERPVVHRDIKPDNVLFVDGIPKVADFGLGKSLVKGSDPTLTMTDVFMGTQPYAAPEQFSSARDVGPPADVYALGKLLWEMLTGEIPEILHCDVEVVPHEFRWFIARCTRRRPEERYPDAGEALEAFRTFIAAPALQGPPLEGAERLVGQWAAASDKPARTEAVRALDDHLQRNASEEELYFKAVPRLPVELLEQYVQELAEPFEQMIAAYEGHISGSLPFAYCDVVADFYAAVWELTESLSLKRTLLARLIQVGATHNRWRVGQVVAGLLAGINDVTTSVVAAEVVRADPDWAEWFWDPWVKRMSLLAPLADAFAETTGR